MTQPGLTTFKQWRIGDVTVTRVQEMPTITMEVGWLFKDTTAQNVRRHDKIHVDDTPVPVLAPGGPTREESFTTSTKPMARPSRTKRSRA